MIEKYKNNYIKNKNKEKLIKKYTNIYGDELTPYISTYYFNPTPNNNEDIIIPLYITDYYQKDYLYENSNETFQLLCEVDGNEIKNEIVNAGDYNLNIGKMDVGIHEISIKVKNKEIESHELWNEIYVKDINEIIEENDIYTITQNDLDKYGIKNTNSNIEEDMINTRLGLTLLFSEIKNNGYKKCILLNGTYRINEDRPSDSSVDDIDIKPIDIPSEFIVDLNKSTIKLYDEIPINKGIIVRMNNCFDSHLINGTIEGSYIYGSNPGSTREHLYAVQFTGCKYCSFENLTVKNINGYASMTTSIVKNRKVISSDGWLKDTYIDENGQEKNKINKYTSSMIDISNMLSDKFLSVNRFLGYQGYEGDDGYVKIHFYDENQNFIKTKKSLQYRKVKIPENSKYIRATINKSYDGAIDFQATNFSTTTNCSFKNINYENTWTCALAPKECNNLLIDSCTFDNCGQCGINDLTPMAIDCEDGWEMTQDVYFLNNTVINQAGTADLLTCRGSNYVVENCNFRIIFREGTIAPVIRNNIECKNVAYYLSDDRKKSRFARIYNNTFYEGISLSGTGTTICKNNNFINCFPSCNEKSLFINGHIDCSSIEDFSVSTYINNGSYLKEYEIKNITAKNLFMDFVYCKDCIIDNINNGNQARGLILENCTVKNSNLSTHGYDCKFIINNCELINCKISSPSWATTKTEIIIKESIINNTNRLLELRNTINGYLKLIGNNINIENESTIYVYYKQNSVFDINIADNENINCMNYILSGDFSKPDENSNIIITSNNNILTNCELINTVGLNSYIKINN